MLCPILLSERSESKNPLLEIVAERVGNLAANLPGQINLAAHYALPFSSCPFAPYYKDVRFPRFLIWVFLAPIALLGACNRGAHPAQTGKAAPDFTVSDGTTTVHLASYRGKVVLLNFWWSECAPCLEELPSLLELHHQMPSLAILAVSIDEDQATYSRFLVRHHVDLITVRDPSESAAQLFHTDMWPETYLIDRNGIIRRKFVGAQDWTSPEIRNYLNSL
jgi:peroxiredoxin